MQHRPKPSPGGGGPEGAGCGGDPARIPEAPGTTIGPTSVSPDGLPPSPQGEGFSPRRFLRIEFGGRGMPPPLQCHAVRHTGIRQITPPQSQRMLRQLPLHAGSQRIAGSALPSHSSAWIRAQLGWNGFQISARGVLRTMLSRQQFTAPWATISTFSPLSSRGWTFSRKNASNRAYSSG